MSVTTVPLRPVSKGGLWLMWFGVAGLIVAAIAFAVSSTPRIGFETIKEGTGPKPAMADYVLVKYEGKLDDGTVFDANERAPFAVAQTAPGFAEGLTRMQKGGKYKLTIPPSLGYGDTDNGPIPGRSTLHFDVELLEFKTEAEMRELQQQMQQQQMMQQQMMQQQQMQGGPPPGAPQP